MNQLPRSDSLSQLGSALGDDDGDDDEDEETLQLKLQEIQARLKLKKLQNARAKDDIKDSANEDRAVSALSTNEQQSPARFTASRSAENLKPAGGNAVEVPASPVRKLPGLQPQTSPSRVLLGIDKGLKAKDVSLKRAPSKRRLQAGAETSQDRGYLRRSRTPNLLKSPEENPRPVSFNERLASVRTEEAAKKERQQRIHNLRTKAFGIGQEEMEKLKSSAVDIPDEPLRPPKFTREDVLFNSRQPPGGLRRSNTVPTLNSQQNQKDSDASSNNRTRAKKPLPEEVPEEECSSFDPYSAFHLSKRVVPHRLLTRHLAGKKILSIKDLLRDVKAPDFALPDFEQDIVVLAIIASKSDPRAHKPTASKNGIKAEERGKYMVVTLVDLDSELDLFLFNGGFTRFWKLTEGNVVAILNPNIMPPPPGRQDTGRFSLVINSDEDTIIEVGLSRDLGFCQSVKKDGQLCMAWVNTRKTHFCEFHSNAAVSKQRSHRMEVNSWGFGSGGGTRRHEQTEIFPTKPKKPGTYDRDTHTHWFAARSMSAADLIDGKDATPVDRKERAEFVKREVEAKEKEVELMKKLGQTGNAAGREYMQRAGLRAANASNSSISSSQPPDSSEPGPDGKPKADARSLGLLSKDHAVHLSPIKRKRLDHSQSSSAAGPSSFGWGSGLTGKLARMKDGEGLRPAAGDAAQAAPTRKKTRFVTEKGIREAGRVSLGMELAGRQVSLGDDDDDLVILE